MFWTYSPSFLMLHMKIFPRPMDGRGQRHETLLNAQTCSTKSKGKPPGMTVSCCRAQAAGIFSCSSPSAFLGTFLSKQWLISRQHWRHQVKLCTSEHSGETALPRRLVLGLVLHLNEERRLLHYKIQPDVVENAINPFKTTTKTKTKKHHTGMVKHFTWSFSWTGKY